MYDDPYYDDEENEQQESTEGLAYCMCGALHSDEEVDWNQCDSCGGKIN